MHSIVVSTIPVVFPALSGAHSHILGACCIPYYGQLLQGNRVLEQLTWRQMLKKSGREDEEAMTLG